jgi:hypothetical protein
VYVPKLQREPGVAGFIREHLGKPTASTLVVADQTEKLYAEVRWLRTDGHSTATPANTRRTGSQRCTKSHEPARALLRKRRHP